MRGVKGRTGEGSQAAEYGSEGLRVRHHEGAQEPQDKGRLGLLALVAHHQIHDLLQIAGMYLSTINKTKCLS